MKNHLSLGRLGHTEIRIHLSMLLLVPYALLQFQPTGLEDALRSLALLALLFVFILLHELGHTAAARLLGIEVRSIVLWPLGGLSELSREPRGPTQTLLVTSAGPLVNVFLALGFGVLFLAMTALDAAVGGSDSQRQELVMRFVLYLGLSNLLLGGFNLIPIYPLDGGRILHALLELVFGRSRADVLVLFVGVPLAVGLMALAWRMGDWLLAGVALLLVIGSASLNEKLFRRISNASMRVTDRGAYHLVHRDFDQAIREYTRQIERRPQAAHLYTNRGQAHLYLGELERARLDFERALAINPASVPSTSLRGDVARAEGDLEKAELLAEQVVRLAPNWYKGYADLAILALERGSLPQALLHIEHALGLESEAPRLYLLRAMIRYGLGNLDGAAQDEAQALRLSPEDALILPDAYRRLLRASPAWTAQYYARAARTLPASPYPQQGWGDALLALGYPSEAESAYTAALQRILPAGAPATLASNAARTPSPAAASSTPAAPMLPSAQTAPAPAAPGSASVEPASAASLSAPVESVSAPASSPAAKPAFDELAPAANPVYDPPAPASQPAFTPPAPPAPGAALPTKTSHARPGLLASLLLRRAQARLSAGKPEAAALDLHQVLALPAPAHLHRQARELLIKD